MSKAKKAVKKVTTSVRNIGDGKVGKFLDLSGTTYGAGSRVMAGKNIVGRDVNNLLGGGGGGGINAGAFDPSALSAEAAKEQQRLLERTRKAAEQTAVTRAEALAQMGRAATGGGPSLAEAQLKSAQDRNLAQMLATTKASRGANPALAQRALMQAQSGAGRELAQQAAAARLQERGEFMSQANMQEAALRGDIGQLGQFGAQRDQSQMNLAQLQEQARQASKNRQTQLMGSLIGGGASVAGSYFGAKDGGLITGPGDGTSDSIPAMLSNGEFVIKAKEVAKPGMLELLQKINSGKLKMKKNEVDVKSLLNSQAKKKKDK